MMKIIVNSCPIGQFLLEKKEELKCATAPLSHTHKLKYTQFA